MEKTSVWAPFDYWRMAEDARAERDRLQSIIKRRKAAGPGETESFMEWDQGNRRYYGMYLEQRRNAKDFEQRAREREAYGA